MRWTGQAIVGALLLTACGGGEADPALPVVRMLTPETGNDINSQHSPDGSRVAFWSDAQNGGWNLMVADANYVNARQVASSSDNTSQPVWSPDGTTLAFTSSTAAIADIWVVKVDGSGLRRLTDAPGYEFPIMWHPSGTRVGYAATSAGGTWRTMEVDVATGTSRPVLPETRPNTAFWSPDGTRLAYVLLDRGANTLWLADSAGGRSRQLTTEGLENFECCSTPWSPDGKELLYTSRRTGTGDIWVIPADSGGTARQLTHDVRADYEPSWSPDGQWILFSSERGRQTDLWAVPARGGEEIRITNDAAAEIGAHWGSTGSVSFRIEHYTQTLWSLALADGKESRLTPDSIRVGGYDVSPDGGSIVLQVDRGGGVTDLAVIPSTGGDLRPVVTGSYQNSEPYFSPDNKRILFNSNRTGSDDIFLVDAAGGEPRQLTDWPTDEDDAEWGGDGSIYFLSSREATPIADLWKIPPAGGAPVRLTNVGTVQNHEPSRVTPDVFVTTYGAKAGEFVLNRLVPGGKLELIWDRSNVLSIGHRTITPKGDSLGLGVEKPGGTRAGLLLSATGGEGRVLLPTSERIGPIAPNGESMVIFLGTYNATDLGLLSLKDGSIRKLMSTPENEFTAQWAGGDRVVFRRSTNHDRIAVADVAVLLGGNR